MDRRPPGDAPGTRPQAAAHCSGHNAQSVERAG